MTTTTSPTHVWDRETDTIEARMITPGHRVLGFASMRTSRGDLL